LNVKRIIDKVMGGKKWVKYLRHTMVSYLHTF
jgi:hypothetical protein